MVLNWLYSVVPNYPVDIILMTILLKLILEPLTYQQLRTSFVISRIQGELQEIAKKYKNDPQQAAQEQSKIYKEHGVNPLIGCLLPLLQIPIFFGLYGSLVQNPNFKGLPFLWVLILASLTQRGSRLLHGCGDLLPVQVYKSSNH